MIGFVRWHLKRLVRREQTWGFIATVLLVHALAVLVWVQTRTYAQAAPVPVVGRWGMVQLLAGSLAVIRAVLSLRPSTAGGDGASGGVDAVEELSLSDWLAPGGIRPGDAAVAAALGGWLSGLAVMALSAPFAVFAASATGQGVSALMAPAVVVASGWLALAGWAGGLGLAAPGGLRTFAAAVLYAGSIVAPVGLAAPRGWSWPDPMPGASALRAVVVLVPAGLAGIALNRYLANRSADRSVSLSQRQRRRGR